MSGAATLGLDTATRATAVGLLAGTTEAEAWDEPAAGERPGHATALMPLAAELLAGAGLRWADVGRIAVGLGPGSYTGMRIGIASARALAQATGATLTGGSTLRALAERAQAELPGRPVLAVVLGGRGEVFAAGWAEGMEILRARPVPVDELAPLVGPVAEGWFAVGDGAPGLRHALTAIGADVPADDSPLHRVSGLAICRMEPAVTGRDNVVPDYLRVPDAERTRLARADSGKQTP
jgi:tRNA threonylcarbamoyladenosine biosynthesis protein TsaB